MLFQAQLCYLKQKIPTGKDRTIGGGIHGVQDAKACQTLCATDNHGVGYHKYNKETV